jgi:hypothetical protein
MSLDRSLDNPCIVLLAKPVALSRFVHGFDSLRRFGATLDRATEGGLYGV